MEKESLSKDRKESFDLRLEDMREKELLDVEEEVARQRETIERELGAYTNPLELHLARFLGEYGYHKLTYRRNGGNGIVFRCELVSDGSPLIVKAIPLQRPHDENPKEKEEERHREVELESSMLHRLGFRDFGTLTRPRLARTTSTPSIELRIEHIKCVTTPAGHFCCYQFKETPTKDGKCEECGWESMYHIKGVYPFALIAMDYRGVELYEFALNLKEATKGKKSDIVDRAYDIMWDVFVGVVAEMMKLWDLKYAHRDLKVENVAVDDRYSIDDYVARKGDVSVSLIDFGAARFIDYENRKDQTPISGLSVSPNTFNIKWELDMRKEMPFKDSARNDNYFIPIDIACFEKLIEKAMSMAGLPLPRVRHFHDPRTSDDYRTLQRIRQADEINSNVFAMDSRKKIFMIHQIAKGLHIPPDEKLDMFRRIIRGVSDEIMSRTGDATFRA